MSDRTSTLPFAIIEPRFFATTSLSFARVVSATLVSSESGAVTQSTAIVFARFALSFAIVQTSTQMLFHRCAVRLIVRAGLSFILHPNIPPAYKPLTAAAESS